MSNSTELSFLFTLVDRFTAPIRRVEKSLSGFADRAVSDFKRIGAGSLAVFGAGMALKSALAPALDLQAALGEVSSLDVARSSLEDLRKTAQKFALDFGGSAGDFVRSAYDIQSAVSGLSGRELSAFTQSSAVLAKATKSDTATITSYMGTMYGIFQDVADKTGKFRWAEQITGQTASAVKMFKTTGSEMSAAFSSLGANAQAMKISAAEQFAVLGQLQATMSGSQAGTQYRAFLRGIGSAQNVLGLNFTNQDGTARSITDILSLIENKFGDLSKVADSDLLKRAFGSDQAVSLIKLLAKNTAGLKNNIQALGNVQGMKTATEMAQKMTDPWQKLSALFEQLRVSVGLRLTPVFAPLIEKILAGGRAFLTWLDDFPNIARWIGYITVAALGLATATGVLTVATGLYSLTVHTLSPLVAKLAGGLTALAARAGALGASLLLPLWPLLAIGAALAALGLAVYKFWQPVRAFFRGFVQGFSAAFDAAAPLGRIFYETGQALTPLWQGLKTIAGWLGKLFAPLAFTTGQLQAAASAGAVFGAVSGAALKGVFYALEILLLPVRFIIAGFLFLNDCVLTATTTIARIWDAFDITKPAESLKKIGGIFQDAFKTLFDSLKMRFAGVFNSIVSKLNLLPGINIGLIDVAPHAAAPQTVTPELLTGGKPDKSVSGGMNTLLNNTRQNNTSNISNRVTLNIAQADKQDIDKLLDEYMMLSGAM